jgi:enoyl-CoA hydratase/carnithine racemase
MAVRMTDRATGPDGEILVSREGAHVARVTLNRPAQANAVSPRLAIELEAAVAALEADDSVVAVVLSAAGTRAFCAGADLKAIAAGQRDQLYTERGGFAGFVQAPRTKFWIACVEAPALAGGLEIALACDMIVASTNATFGLPEVQRALIAAAGGLARLPRRVPRGLALEMIATGEAVTATRAHAAGLVNHLTPSGEAFYKAVAVAERVAANAPLAVAESLAVARRADDLTEAELFALSRAAADRNYRTQNFAEGPRAFIEKRAPIWVGA